MSNACESITLESSFNSPACYSMSCLLTQLHTNFIYFINVGEDKLNFKEWSARVVFYQICDYN